MRCLWAAFGLVWGAAVHGDSTFKLYGLNYNSRQGPDWDPNRCKSQAQIDLDMVAIAKVASRVRIFSLVDCNQGYMVTTAAKKAGLRVWLGMWVTSDQASLNHELAALDTLVADGIVDNTSIDGMHVGSESLYRKDMTPDQAINYYAAAKTYLTTKNLTFPVSITDVIDTLLAFPQVVSVVDVVMGNAFPFWEKADVDTAVQAFETKYNALVAAAGGKDVWVGETGWPSDGVNANASVASPRNQAAYIADFVAFAAAGNVKYFLFSAFDDTWKVAQERVEDTVEAHFGLLDSVTRELKPDLDYLPPLMANGKFASGFPGAPTTRPGSDGGGEGAPTESTGAPEAPIPTSGATLAMGISLGTVAFSMFMLA